MCIAIFKPAGKEMKVEHLHQSWIGNSDGAGFAFIKDGEVVISKGYMTYKEFESAYLEAEFMFPDSPFLIHFRIRSMGERDAENTHPFKLPDGGALIHNGTISGTGAQYLVGKSDTALFVEKYGKALTYDIVEKEKLYIETSIDYNKLVILYPDGRHHILNKEYGVEHNGIWYSNDTFMPWAQRGGKLGDGFCYT
jgi:hypothetical protein